MINFFIHWNVLLFACATFVYSENQYLDFNSAIEITKIRKQSVVGEWTEFTNKSLPFDEFRQKKGLQYLRSGDYPYTGYYVQVDGKDMIRSLRHFKDGLLEGPIASWRENGMKFYQGFYDKGKKHGVHQYWSEKNIKILEQNFKEGKLDGYCIRWYQSGLKSSEQIFQNGKILSAIGWKPDGERCPSTQVIEGVGVMVVYDDFGTVTNREKLKVNPINRTVERYENGNIREEGYYKNDKKDGIWIFYRMDGTEHFRVTFREGVRIKTEFSKNPI